MNNPAAFFALFASFICFAQGYVYTVGDYEFLLFLMGILSWIVGLGVFVVSIYIIIQEHRMWKPRNWG